MNKFFDIVKFFQLISFMSLTIIKTNLANINSVLVEPEFVDVMQNITVAAGRNVKFACSVKNLGSYKVAWMFFEQSAILAVHNHVITRNPRISVTHDKHRTWFLHINNVQEEDKGRYMCQINTVVAKTQFGYLDVVVPPNIDDTQSSTDVLVREGNNETLICKAKGLPAPNIKWRRNDGHKITINKTLSDYEWEGESLQLIRISRLEMGAYLCIASNGIPPTVSKRIQLNVEFPPVLWIPHQLVGAPMGQNATLECHSEAFPTSLNYWIKENGQMIHNSHKYHTENIIGDPIYKIHMKLTIFNSKPSDFGTYKCIVKNSRGETDGSIRLYVSTPPTTTTIKVTTILIKSTEKTLTTISNQGNNKRSWNSSRKSSQDTSQFKGSNYRIPNEINSQNESKSYSDLNKKMIKMFDWTSKQSQSSTD